MTSRQRLLSVAVVVLAARASSFEIKPRNDVHESLTAAAAACVSVAQSLPEQCPQVEGPNQVTLSFPKWDSPVDVKKLGLAVRWPDDPTGEVSASAIGKFAVKMGSDCAKYRESINTGLLCSSHYGPLQFMHAMASTSTESSLETQTRILDWSAFLFDVATGDIDLKTPYCEYFAKERPIKSALFPEKFLGCTTKRPWTVSTLFSLKCRNPVSSVNCDESLVADFARVRALGALLHVIQDSYAQGHTNRATCRLEAPNEYACAPIKQFHDYSGQDSALHRVGDQPPIPGSSCVATHEVHDPVLASARALWFIAHRERDAFLEDLTKRVFPLAVDAQQNAGPGACFANQHKPGKK